MLATKRTRRVENDDAPCFDLPPEIIQRIAIFIPDTSSFFNFLEAFQEHKIYLGNLQLLYETSVHYPHHAFWPGLHVKHDTQRAHENITDTNHIVPRVHMYYSTVHVHGIYEFDTLDSYTASPTTKLAFYLCPIASEIGYPLEEWYYDFATTLPIEHITWVEGRPDDFPQPVDVLVDVLPHMIDLRSLDLFMSRIVAPDKLFEFIRTSKLTRLSLNKVFTCALDDANEWTEADEVAARSDMTTARLLHLIHWLTHEAVETLNIGLWNMRTDAATMAHFFRALWANTTLHTFHAPRTRQLDLMAYEFKAPLHVQRLNLSACGLRDDMIRRLATGLKGSSVAWLDLSSNPIGPDAMEALADALPPSLFHLQLTRVAMEDIGLGYLLYVLPAMTCLTDLFLDGNDITDSSMMFLAAAIQTTPALEIVTLRENEVTPVGIAAMIRALGKRPAPPDLSLIDLDENSVAETDVPPLTLLLQHVARHAEAPLPQLSFGPRTHHPNDRDWFDY
ncbi:Aste57867_21486 [Aphanomyces stellatus]|uniref:Aste57867_21486 protein n=1 Tax=Aphanomyces stellatus TaxID=120398 RepID=A0A485LIA0_9STRA|nr:hypothetical protein As57867_021417 [Aphanomyces stellatus]VFT98156.1 Aste57867_21486 [Aphanomyces stellatus]